MQILVLLSSFATLSILVKAMDWMRLFDQTSFYILLIGQTLNDVFAFLILIIMSLLMFGFPMIMLNMNRSEENLVVEENFSFWLPNMLLNQYELALGEFNMDGFSNGPQENLCWIFFILATFFSQITMFNMLIAIMGDTFERIIENKELNSTMTKLELMSELSTNIHDEEEDNMFFLYVVQPDEAD